MNALMLAAALCLGGMRIRPLRLLLGAAAGAGAALCARRFNISRAMLCLPAAAGMMCLAAGRHMYRRPVWHIVLLFSAGGLMGGTVLALSGALGSLFAAYPAACISVLYLVLYLRRERIKRVYIECAGVRMPAIVDTGNTLRDYLTHLPVVVVPEGCALAKALAGVLPLRPIFADTAGGRQMMRLCVPQRIRLVVNGRKQTVRAAVAMAAGLHAQSPALAPTALTDGE